MAKANRIFYLFILQEPIAHIKAQLLSRRVWDILQAVPLNPTLLEAFQNPIEAKLPELLDPTSPQKLMYSLHIIDKLSSTNGPTSLPASLPSTLPTAVPTTLPNTLPTAVPNTLPTAVANDLPTDVPTTLSTVSPTSSPTVVANSEPTKDKEDSTTTTSEKEKEEEKNVIESWNDLFIKRGGLRILYDILMSGK